MRAGRLMQSLGGETLNNTRKLQVDETTHIKSCRDNAGKNQSGATK